MIHTTTIEVAQMTIVETIRAAAVAPVKAPSSYTRRSPEVKTPRYRPFVTSFVP